MLPRPHRLAMLAATFHELLLAAWPHFAFARHFAARRATAAASADDERHFATPARDFGGSPILPSPGGMPPRLLAISTIRGQRGLPRDVDFMPAEAPALRDGPSSPALPKMYSLRLMRLPISAIAGPPIFAVEDSSRGQPPSLLLYAGGFRRACPARAGRE